MLHKTKLRVNHHHLTANGLSPTSPACWPNSNCPHALFPHDYPSWRGWFHRLWLPAASGHYRFCKVFRLQVWWHYNSEQKRTRHVSLPDPDNLIYKPRTRFTKCFPTKTQVLCKNRKNRNSINCCDVAPFSQNLYWSVHYNLDECKMHFRICITIEKITSVEWARIGRFYLTTAHEYVQ